MHIAITGNIGAGKTTLAQLLSAHYGWEVLYEAVEGNPYLADFYADMERWSFNLQIYFLNSRFEQVRTIRESGLSIIQDRTIYEDAYIFAANLYRSGNMTERDYQTYRSLFDNIVNTVQAPNLMIYLQAGIPKLMAQIKKRGRAFEQSIDEEYLSSLNKLYEEFSEEYKGGNLLIINVDSLDYNASQTDLLSIIQQVDERLAVSL